VTAPVCFVTRGLLLDEAAHRLREAGIENPWQEAYLLLGHVLQMDKAALLAHPEIEVSVAGAQAFRGLTSRRVAREPIAYLLERRAFFGREFRVDRSVLIPRPETELLVECALEALKTAGRAPLVIDVGTGSGCVAATVALECEEARVVAADLSSEALSLAEQNLRTYGIEARVALVQGDLLTWLARRPEIVLANLPYIPSETIGELPPDVRCFEPRLALDGGPRGTEQITRLIRQARELSCAVLLAELDPRHALEVLHTARSLMPDARIEVLRDHAGRQRLLRAGRPA
jgi:release factor glutamine methyltransferase